MTSPKTLLLFPLLLLCAPAFGQREIAPPQNGLSVHLTTGNLLDQDDRSFTLQSAAGDQDITMSFARATDLGLSYVRTQDNGTFYRIGVIGLSIAESRDYATTRSDQGIVRTTNGEDQSLSRVNTQLEIGKLFTRSTFRYGLGLFVQPSYLHFTSTPPTALDFDFRIQEVSLRTGLNPIVEYHLGDNVVLSGQLPTSFSKIAYTHFDYENPFLTERERNTEEFSARFEWALALQIGLMIGF